MIIIFLIGTGLGLGLGAGLVFWRTKTEAKKRKRIPREWPLKVRTVVNSQERKVWGWLSKVMFDQQILLKVPVTRFTVPSEKDDAGHWYQLLNGVYCTFTVCSADGRVFGCVDVQGPNALSMGNQTLKHSLLSQCGIRYWVVNPANLPELTQIRSAFLGELAVKGAERDLLELRFKDVRKNLQDAVTRQRQGNAMDGIEVKTNNKPEYQESRLASGWEQNSFLTPLDSRQADL
jgi:Protein of unknown function (DUF2726)